MGPRKREARKRKNEDSLGEKDEDSDEKGTEERRDRRKNCGNKYIGAHVGIQGGIWKAVEACTEMGGSSFALFLGSQRSWKRPALDQTAAERFREECSLQGFNPAHIVPHGSYLMNCGSPKEDVFEKSQALLVDELSRCSLLGLNLYNFHPGSSLGTITTEQCVEKIAGAINHAHQQTPAVVTVLENMSGQGSTVGGKFVELKSIIDKVRDQTRVGVCLDTCHAFAAGKLGCHLDRHEDIGKGHIGISAFRDIVNEPRLDNIPLILETPGRPGFEYAEQIELLYSLCKK
ncbi:probable endonuclease 4 isoform X2 [Acanthochromis polyacanthus]|uniref:probable endonuclease 4 isoform X2 n=1 Tax=Acanthochromis polyacanthus TaxID=80966 RepID=UPI0022348288|nr:probable endonuclease 4 isoform X2 [Acanthochromis polyacanthus]